MKVSLLLHRSAHAGFRFLTMTILAAGPGALSPVDAGPEAHPTEILKLSSCQLPGVSRQARCGTFEVPENPERPAGRHLAIGVAVLPATGGHAKPDPIVPLMGGPGEDAIGAAELYTKQFATLQQDHDLLLVDQRGTGRSGALRCDLFSSARPAESLRDLFPQSRVEDCERRLSQRADLTQYTYDRFANDLEQIRRALGYGPMNLFSGSYGTRAAQVFVRMYPNSVRTAYLGSAVPLDARNPLPFAKTGQAALEKLLDACAADSACHSAFPDLRDEFRDLSARLGRGPVPVMLPGQSAPVALYGGRVAEWFRYKLYRPYSSSELPWVIHRAHQGDWSPIAEDILSEARSLGSDLSVGLLLSITCSEDVAFINQDDVPAATADTFLGDYRIRQQQTACKHWPKTLLPKGYRDPVHSAVPTVFASGDADGGTPLWYTERVAAGFTHRHEVLMRGLGHTQWSDCVADIYQRLVVTGGIGSQTTSACPLVPRPPFKTQ